MHQPPCFLINLDRNPERLVAATAALAQIGLMPERVPAVEGRALGEVALRVHDAAALATIGRRLSPGEVGCFLSHVACAQLIVERDLPFALVLEDDVALAPDTGADLVALLDLVASRDFDLVNLGRAPSKFFRAEAALPSGRALGRAWYFPVTTSALLWSQAGARSFLAAHRIAAPVDVFLQGWLSGTGRGLACAPALFGLSGAASEIGTGSGRKLDRARGYTALRLRRQASTLARAALGWLRRG